MTHVGSSTAPIHSKKSSFLMKHSYLEFNKLYPSFISLMIKKNTTDENRSDSVNIFLQVYSAAIYQDWKTYFCNLKENPLKERNRMNIKKCFSKKKKARPLFTDF